jgi:hypothetical protein
MVEFKEFEKIPRLNREVVITEKIDGTNACVVVVDVPAPKWWQFWKPPAGRLVFAQSRNRLLTLDNDNAGFASWVYNNAEELKQLGPGYHYGEWWGQKIGRNYGLKEKRFSLFNSWRWVEDTGVRTELEPGRDYAPKCCNVVPIIATCSGLETVNHVVDVLRAHGSYAAPGFMDPEGVIVFHTAANKYFKVTIKGDESPKGKKLVI